MFCGDTLFETNETLTVTLSAPGYRTTTATKTFTTVSTAGTGWIERRVFRGLMNAEHEAAADALALDARGRSVPEPSGAYGWPARAQALVSVFAEVR